MLYIFLYNQFCKINFSVIMINEIINFNNGGINGWF